MPNYLVRLGKTESLAVLDASNEMDLNTWIACESRRGLEIAYVMRNLTDPSHALSTNLPKVTSARLLSEVDHAQWSMLKSACEDSFLPCIAKLRELRCEEMLTEIEPLLDGSTLFFHFIGDHVTIRDELLDQLAQVVEQHMHASIAMAPTSGGCGENCRCSNSQSTSSEKQDAKHGCNSCSVAVKCKAKIASKAAIGNKS